MSGAPNRGGAGPLTEGSEGLRDEGTRDRELELWNILLNHEGRRELAIEHWNGELTGHAMALARLGVISLGELNEMLDYADAAYSYVIEQRETRGWSSLVSEDMRTSEEMIPTSHASTDVADTRPIGKSRSVVDDQ